LGLRLWKELKRTHTNMAILVWDSFQLLSQLAPDTRPLRVLKMIYHTKEVGTSKMRVKMRVTLVTQVAATVVVAVMVFPALKIELLLPAKAQVTKRLRASSKQNIKNVSDMAEAGWVTQQNDSLHHAERKGLSFGTNDFKLEDHDRQIDLLVQVLPDNCIKPLLNEDWDSLNNSTTRNWKLYCHFFDLKAIQGASQRNQYWDSDLPFAKYSCG